MNHNVQEFHVIVRESQKEAQKKARESLAASAVTGKVSMDDIATARGMVIREREHSIFSDAWIPLAILFLIIGYFADRNAAMLALGAVLLLIVGVSTLWKNVALLGVTYERKFDRTRAFPGEPINMVIEVGNDKLLPLTWLQFRDDLPVSPEVNSYISQTASKLRGKYVLYNTFSMQAREKTSRETQLIFPHRGYYTLGPVTYESGDVFTLFTIERQHEDLDRLIIYPQIWPLEELGLPAKEPFGDVKVHRSLFTDPIKTQGIRDYQPQDRFRDVHWKATARKGSLQTKVYDPSTGMTLAVFLNVATFERHWMGFDPEVLERAISVAGSMANYGFEQGWGIGVYANGSVPGSDQPIRVPPSRSPDQLSHVLEALAAVTEFATGSIELMMLRESPRLPWVSTVVLITAVVTDDILVTLVRLKEAGRRIVLVSLADEPPPNNLGQIITYHIPSSVQAFQQQAGTTTMTEAGLANISASSPVALHQVKDEEFSA